MDLSPYYLSLRTLHISCVILTAVSFSLRSLWMLQASPVLQRRWVKIVPHIIDTLLLFSGLSLMLILHQYPFVHGWLTAKFFALLAYIVCGSIALNYGRTRLIRVLALGMAYLSFAYLVATAWQHNPLPWLLIN